MEMLSKVTAYLSIGTLLLLIIFWKQKWIKFRICPFLAGIASFLWGYEHFFYLNVLKNTDKGFWVSEIAHKSFGVILALFGLFLIIVGIIFNIGKADIDSKEQDNHE